MATIQSVKDKIQGLIDKSNEATGGSDMDLTTAIDNLIANQGGGEVPKEKLVNFWDYDGTLLYSYTLAEARALTSLPPLPVYKEETRFYATKWTKTLEEVKSVIAFLDVTVQVTHATSSSRIYCCVAVFDISRTLDNVIELYISKPSSSQIVYVDWGDGSKATLIGTGTSTITKHTYPSRKRYTVFISSDSTGIRLGGNTSTYMFTKQGNALVSFLGGDGYIPQNYAFSTNTNLKFIYLATPTTVNNYILYRCYSLRVAICDFLNSTSCFEQCYSLERIRIPLPQNNTVFTSCNNLNKILITESTGSLTSMTGAVRTLFITASSVITYSASITVGRIIYVNDDLVDSYKSATGWVDHASYIFPISSYTDE